MDEPVVRVSDEMIDQKALELRPQKLEGALAIAKALNTYARGAGLFQMVPRKLDIELLLTEK